MIDSNLNKEQSVLLAQNALLERVSSTYRRHSPQDVLMKKLCVRSFEPWLGKDNNGLEVGCSDGLMTELLAERLRQLDVVEATDTFLNEVRQRNIKNVVLHHALIEGFETDQKFDRIFATWVLTHFIDVQFVLSRLRNMLTAQGLLFVAVPNVRVLSRQLALHMGLIDDLYALTENDRNHGHVHAYDRARLNKEMEKAGFETIAQGGLMLKMLADFQMDQLIDSGMLGASHIEGFYKLGCEYPDFSSAIYSVCRVK